jgi:hypothetical protein
MPRQAGFKQDLVMWVEVIMRKSFVSIAALAMLMAPNAVLAQEQSERPEMDPSANQQPAQTTPPAYPASDGAGAGAGSQANFQAPASDYQPPAQSYQPPASDYQNPAPMFPPAQESFQPSYQPPAGNFGGSPFYQNRQNYNYGFGGPSNYTGYSPTPSYQQYPQWGPPGAMLHPRVATAPAGLTINVDLQTAISTQVAKDGDFVQAKIAQNVPLSGLSYIPAGSVITGQVTEAQAGRMMNRSGSLSVTFNKLQLPDGQSVPIQAHVLGDIGKYANKNGEYHGEGWGAKLAGFGERAAIGAGGGALFGTALGGITGRVGTGAWAGTAIGGGLGVVDDLFLRRGRNVLIQSGTPMQIQLDQQVDVPVELPQQSAYGAS